MENEEQLLGGTLPELTEEERLQLLAEQQQLQNEIDVLSEGTEPQVTETTESEASAQPVQEEQQQEQPTGIRVGNDFIDRNAPENVKAGIVFGTSLLDAGADLLNLIPGVNLPKVPKFEQEVTQTVREVSSVVLPTMVGTGALTSAAKGAGFVQKSKFLSDPLVAWMGSTAAAGGVGATVDYAIEFNQEDDNLTGMLQKTWPRWWGWVPDNIATLDGDSPDTIRAKNVTEGLYLGAGSDTLMGMAKLFRALRGIDNAAKLIPESEKAKKWIAGNVEFDATPEDVVERGAAKRADALDEVGIYNFEKSVDINKPVFGYHDLYGYQEMGIRSVDDLGIVGASIHAARIATNDGTIYGRVGNVMSEGALKFANESSANARLVMKGLGETLKDAGEYGYSTAPGKYLSHVEIKSIGDDIASDFYEMDLDEMKRYITRFQGENVDTGVAELTSEGYAGVMGAIKKYMDDFMNMDEVRAQGYVGTSMAGQISDMSQGVRLADGNAAVGRAQEMVLDRVEFLMAQKAMTSYVRGRALNQLNLWDRMTLKGTKAFDKAEAKRLTNLIKDEKNTTLAAMERMKQEAAVVTNNLRAINKNNPEMLAPLMMAYELTDGNVRTITALNKYVKASTGVMSKAFIDRTPDIPSVVVQGFYANLYNSTLSAFGTLGKAGISASQLLVEKPLRTFAGAARNRDWKQMRRGWYQFGDSVRSIQKGLEYANQIFKRSGLDPDIVPRRENIPAANPKQVELLRTFADAKAAAGEFGPQYMVEIIDNQLALAKHPWLRLGQRGMQAYDGFTQSMIASFESRGRIFDELTDGGQNAFDVKKAGDLEEKAYRDMFDEDGLIKDKAVLAAAGEISMNIDNAANRALSDLIRQMPMLKPFLLFTKTPLNELALTASYNPVGFFIKDMNQFKLTFDEMPFEQAEQLLANRGVKASDGIDLRMKYNEIRDDIMGRKALGSLMVGSTVGLLMTDRITGYGLYNRQKQKVRDDLQKKRLSITGPDGKQYSYDGLGPITNWVGLIATIGENFDMLTPDEVGENLKIMSFILASSVTEKSMLTSIQPLLDIVRGDVGAINKWSASFISSANIRGSSQLAELGRLMDPGLKEVEQNIADLVLNRLPGLKSTLAKEWDYIDGGEVGVPDNFLTRLRNTYTPFKVSDSISKEKQFLIDIEYDATPTLSTDGKGNDLSNQERAAIKNKMGERKYFRDEIRRVMNGTNAKEFRKRYKEAKEKNLRPDLSFFENVHYELDKALRDSMKMAAAETSSFNKIQQRAYVQNVVGEYLRRGDQDSAERFLNQMEKLK
tara:strand:- start:1214 stop:5104 length:3891 start_codon:yes stop_codon:yes gene_type:complete